MCFDGLEFVSVVAVDRHWCIGKDDSIPWRLPADLAHFKRLTMGGRIIMGRRTHESIGRALPGRENIVLSSRTDYVPAAGCVHEQGIESLCRRLLRAREGGDERGNFVIGGARVYDDFLPAVTTIHLTVVDTIVEQGNTFLSPLDPSQWTLVSSSVHGKDEKHGYAFVMHELRRVERSPDSAPQQEISAVPRSWLP